MDDCEVGYKKPPEKHRFRPGQSGNPAGSSRSRRKAREEAAVPSREAVSALAEIASERIKVGGRKMSRTGALLRILFACASKGDMRAMRLYFQICEKTGLLERAIEPGKQAGGVLVVPRAIDEETWEYLASRNQAKFRTSEPWQPEEFVLASGDERRPKDPDGVAAV